MGMMYGLLAFAAVFIIVGVLRVVEISAAGLRPLWRRILIPLHVVGCLCFAGAIVLLAIDETGSARIWTSSLFYAGVMILFPLHIFLAIKRRIRMSK